jgi:riboflavin synthase
VSINNSEYTVTAIEETLKKSCIGNLKIKDKINLERGMKLGDRLDGHIVQGHVDQVGTCTHILENNGSWVFTFNYDSSLGNVTIEKGSITVNGVSLTVVDSKKDSFSVAIIPYTYNNTTFNNFRIGSKINLEFDVIGKYVQRLTKL